MKQVKHRLTGKRPALFSGLFFFLGAVGWSGAVAAQPRTLDIDDVLRMALASDPGLQAARAHAGAADELRSSARGRLLPVITVADEYQHWDSPFEIGFGGSTFRARNEDTNTFTAALSQPLLGLLQRVQDFDARARTAEAREAGTRVAEANLKEALESYYLRLFEARAMQAIAKASQGELEQQVSSTQVKVAAGTLTRADLLRVQVALGNARQQEIIATTAQTTARASLLSAIGLSPEDTSVEFKEPTRLLEQGGRPPSAAPGAADQRPEIAQARLDAEAAHHEERSRFYALLPEVDLEAAYQRVDGQVFAPKNAAFVGVKAAWPIWEWGSTHAAHAAAEQEEVAARANVDAAQRRVQVEVTSRRAELSAADNAVNLARETVASAEEAYRVMDAVVRVGSGTTTDLLDAQSALTQARLRLTHSEYERAIAYVQLERASGAGNTTPPAAKQSAPATPAAPTPAVIPPVGPAAPAPPPAAPTSAAPNSAAPAATP
jgi:outer membrane protein